MSHDDLLSTVTETKAFGNLQKLGQLNWLCHASVDTALWKIIRTALTQFADDTNFINL